MKKFTEMNLQEIEQIVNRSKELRDQLESYIQECEMDFISDKLFPVKNSLSDWSIGFWDQNYINVKDYHDFVAGVRSSVKSFGCSDRLEKLLSQCEKLEGTNLFFHQVRLLKTMWLEDEIQSICKYVEDAGFELYLGKVGEKSRDYLEGFIMIYENYLYDEETETIYKPTKLEVS